MKTSIETYGAGLPSAFQTLRVSDNLLADEPGNSIELDGPQAWALYKELEGFINSTKTVFPEAILAFEFEEGYDDTDPVRYAWRAELFSPCCGAEVKGHFVEVQEVDLDVEEVHDGTVSLDSSDGDGGTLLHVCASCNLGVSIPSYLDLEW